MEHVSHEIRKDHKMKYINLVTSKLPKEIDSAEVTNSIFFLFLFHSFKIPTMTKFTSIMKHIINPCDIL